VATLIGWLPPRVGVWLGSRLGDLAFFLLARRRRTALANLALAFPDLDDAARRWVCRRSFQHLGVMGFELCATLAHPIERTLARIRLDGLEHLRAAMAAHGRALVLTAHLGNWELLTVAHRLTGYRLAIVVRPLDSPWLNALAERLRRKSGVELIDKRGALRPVLRALGGGRLVAILLDQNAARRESVFVPFFGRRASTSKSLALLARRTGAPVVPIFIRRESAGWHRVTVLPALRASVGGADATLADLTARCTEAIETAIRGAPEQWLWVHDRWRTRPGEGNSP
jgi:KDO2-lipid IV(A) lauroyltransferase